MNITINIKFTANVLLLTMFALFTYSCTKENETTGARIYEGEKIPMSIKMGTRSATTDKDEVIKSVRAIVFNDKDELVYNDVSGAFINVDGIYTASIRAARGYNNIYIICNETPELTEKLAAITLENEIEKVTFSAIGIVAPPPMYGNVVRAYVESRSDGKNATVTINDIKMTELPVKVTRMVSRISFTAIKNIANENEDFKVTKLSIKVCHMPATTSIGGGVYTGSSWSDDLIIPGTGELDNNGAYTINDNNYSIPDAVNRITIPDTYIPEHLLSEPADISQATYLKIDAQCVLKNGSTQVLNGVYLLNIGQAPPQNHNLTRNHHYQIYATITGMGAMGLYAEIVAMEEHDITINWRPIDGLVIVSDKLSDYDPATGTSKNVNIWNDPTVYSGILKAYHSDTGYKDVLFKYGSLIAIHSDPAATEGTAFVPPSNAAQLNDVLWYPSSYSPLSIKKWEEVPYLLGGEVPASNTIEKVASGQGDPCKLAGLSEIQIRDMKIVDNGQWHMATSEEYNHLITAADKEASAYGFLTYHWLMLPHNHYRDTDCASRGDGTIGQYWTSDASTFVFSGKTPESEALRSGYDRKNGYMVRCVRNEIPESYIRVGTISSPGYQGTENGQSAYFAIASNIPYWTATLVTEGADKGSTSQFDDFSFEPFASGSTTTVHTTHGSNTQNIKVHVKRKESTQSRTFRVRVKGFGLDGVERSTLLTISQDGYILKATTELSNVKLIPQEGGTYKLNIQLTPDDVTIPAGELYIQAVYQDKLVGFSDKVATEANKYNYPNISIKISSNDSPSAINLTVYVYLMRDNVVIFRLSGLTIMQAGYK